MAGWAGRGELVLAFVVTLLISGCSGSSWPINEIAYPSKNYSSRVRVVVIHYTAGNFTESVATLTGKDAAEVSSHYLIPDMRDSGYPLDRPWIFRLVDDDKRAWHAGTSYWQAMTSLNDNSIGIEITNQSHCDNIGRPDETCTFQPFAQKQISALIDLLGRIENRHGPIEATRYVGHGDIAPDRKRDPGPLFPWKQLYDAGFGAWPDSEAVKAYRMTFEERLPSLSRLQEKLNEYGYQIEATGENDQQSQNAVRAFQEHFRPGDTSGTFDVETAAILYALLEKYMSG